MYLTAISEVCGNSGDYSVLDNIVQYASGTMETILLAKLNHIRTDYMVQAEQLAHFAQRMSCTLGEVELSGEKK